MQNYTGLLPNTSDDEDALGEEDDMGFIPETMPIDRVKWYELQKGVRGRMCRVTLNIAATQ